jgi:hypothetical protein
VLLITWQSFRAILASFRKNLAPELSAGDQASSFPRSIRPPRLRSSCYPTSVNVARGFVAFSSFGAAAPVGSFVTVDSRRRRWRARLSRLSRVSTAENRTAKWRFLAHFGAFAEGSVTDPQLQT